MIALLDKLKEHLPFSLLSREEHLSIESSAQIAYYPKDTRLFTSGEKPENLYYVIKGLVESKQDSILIDMYNEDDTFAGIELIEDQPSTYDYVVQEELICYELPKEVFLKLCESNQAFKAYFFSSLLERIEMIKERKESGKMADMMVARVDATLLHDICIVEHTMDIVEALAKMEKEKASALLVKNRSGYGIVTDSDLRGYILHKERDNLERIADIQTYPIIAISEGELLFNVLLLMTGNSIKHLPVLDAEGNPIGILALIDLLSYFSNQSHLIGNQIDHATDLGTVISASRRIEVMIASLHHKGVKFRYIARLVSEIHKKMYAKLFALIFPASWQENATLILLGSEGRGEQVLRTDQDNAIIFKSDFKAENKETYLLQFTEALDEIGFPRCEGNVMVINPKWSKDVQGYKQDIRNWIDMPNEENLLDLAIFYDAYAVAGNKTLLIDLRKELIEKVKGHTSFFTYFGKAVESFESPLGLFSRFISTDDMHKNEVDIKKGALFALIHGVRVLALEYGITKTNTTERIKALHTLEYMSKEDASNLIEALEILMTLRLHARLEKLEEGKEMNNYIALERLSKLEKDTFKEALKMVETFKERVAYHFHLSVVR